MASFSRRSVERDVSLVTEQVRGLRGLFEASDRGDPEEFELFSQIVGFTPSRLLWCMPR